MHLIKFSVLLAILTACMSMVGCEKEKDQPVGELNTEKRFVVYDFSASWCGPCHKYAPTFEKLKAKYSRNNIEFRTVDIDADKETPEKFGVEGYPTVVVTADGKLAAKFLGGASDSQLAKVFKK